MMLMRMLRGLPSLDCLPLQNLRRVRDGRRIRNLHQYLTVTVRAEALLAGVLIFNLEDVSVGTFGLNSHSRPASPNR
jgi:hypothetical protein